MQVAPPPPAEVVVQVAAPEIPAAQVVMVHPARAVQHVERDPDTLEIIRTVTDYEAPSPTH